MGGQQSHSISEPGHSRPLEFSIHPVFTLPPPRSPRSALSVRSISSEVLRHSLKLGSLPSAPQHLSASQVPVRFFKMIKTKWKRDRKEMKWGAKKILWMNFNGFPLKPEARIWLCKSWNPLPFRIFCSLEHRSSLAGSFVSVRSNNSRPTRTAKVLLKTAQRISSFAG